MNSYPLPAQTNQSEHSAFRVLLVDDYGDTTFTTALLLRREGHDVEVAEDGASALQMSETYQPDLILLDIGLPDMDGWEVARQIRQQENGKRSVLIAVSGYATMADRQRSQQAGIDLHLAKPIDPKELFDLLAKLKAVADSSSRGCAPTDASGLASPTTTITPALIPPAA